MTDEAQTPPPADQTPPPPAAPLDPKAEKQASKHAAAVAAFERKVARKQAEWEASAAMRTIRAAFREKHPEIKSLAGQGRAMLAATTKALDSVSPSTFIRFSDRGLTAALVALYIVCYSLDLYFFGNKAPEAWLIPVFILLGFTLRTTAIAAGVMLETMADKDPPKTDEKRGFWDWTKARPTSSDRARLTWRLIWLGCVIACMFSAVSFFVGRYQKQEFQTAAVTDVSASQTSNLTDQIAALDAQADKIRVDRDTNIATLQQTSDGITHDRNASNDGEAVKIAAQQAAEMESARVAIANIEATKTSLIAQSGQTKTDTTKELAQGKTETATTWAVFTWFSGRTGAQERDVVDIGMLFFAVLVEFMAAFGTGAFYALRRWFRTVARRMMNAEQEEAAQLDLEMAQSEQRIELSKAAAAAARTKELDDDEAVLEQAKEIEAQAARDLELAKSQRRAAELRAEAEALRKPPAPPPPPSPPDPPQLTPQQQAALNASRAAELARNAKGVPDPGVPVGAWSKRPDRANGAAIQ